MSFYLPNGVYYVKNPMQDNDNGKIEFIPTEEGAKIKINFVK